MKKKITIGIFIFILCLCAGRPALAADADGFAGEYERVNDMAGLLTESEEAALLKELDEISLRQKVDVTVATVRNLEGYDTATECADALYEFCRYGYGQDKDGILLLISVETHDWAISTCGYGITVLSETGRIESIGTQMQADLSDSHYAAAFAAYARLCDEFITQTRQEASRNGGHPFREPLPTIWIPISIVSGIVVALILVGGMKSKLKTVRSQTAANSYMKKESLAITESSDLFLYQTVTRSEKEKTRSTENSTHSSASGTTHGGGSGKF